MALVDQMTFEWIKSRNISVKDVCYLILPLVLLLVVFPSIIQQDQGFISSKYDTLLTVNSELSVANDPLALWNPNWLTGIPEYALSLSEKYYPTFIPSLPFSQDIYLTNWLIIIHLFLAYLFFFKMSGLMTRNPELRMIFSTIYMFSGILLARVDAGHLTIIYALTWIPLMYYAFFKMIWDNDTSVINIIIFSVSFAIIFFTGAVYYLFYSCALLAIFFIYYLLMKKLSSRMIIAVLLSAFIGTLLLAVKLIPVVISSSALGRIDVINPLGDGGSLENNIASFIVGTPIDQVFSSYESLALIGIIPVLLLIIAFVYGREDRTIPAFFAMVFAFIWADGGQTLLSFIHLLPGVVNFRVAGRIFGALLPILLLFSLYGFNLLLTRLKNEDLFEISYQQKKNIIYGICVLLILKLLELPFQGIGSIEAWISLAIIAIFVALLYCNQATVKNLMVFFSAALVVDAILIYRHFSAINTDIFIKSVIVVVIISAVVILFNRQRIHPHTTKSNVFCGLLMVGILIMAMGNFSYLTVSHPNLDYSPAIPIIEKIKSLPTNESQIWVLETGWPFQHEDFTYWFIKSGIHPIRVYYPNYLLTTLGNAYTIGNTSYYVADYIVDNQYLENGNQNIDNVTFKVQNISIYQPDHVLPNAFVIRKNEVVPVKIEKFSSDEVRISGHFTPGDIAVLKTSYYPGWKVNGQDALNAGNMVAAQVTSETPSITFKFDPNDVKIGYVLTGIGIIILVIIIIKRREIEQYFVSMDVIKKEQGSRHKKKKQ